ncbi:malate transporter [Mycoplasmopsis californica]|uniref:malate transporter n=1 Tax=Mycoplasmopsis californica TaxID=2113 RepID=UPI000EB64E04|nr:malate transporter [Mycoplasmopsis californica]BBG42485.1 malate permease [Mycoplasmopsis californica]
MNHLVKILTSQALYGAVLATLTFVLIGWIITRKGLFTKEINGKISKFLLDWALPFLCLVAFMVPADATIGKEVGVVIGLSAAFYILMAVYSFVIVKFFPRLISTKLRAKARLAYEKSDKSATSVKYEEAYVESYAQKILAAQMMVSYASLQFFAVPLVNVLGKEVFGGTGTALLQVWNLPYMIGAFSYLKFQYSGQKFTKDQVKPVVKALFTPMLVILYASMILWALQFIPGLNAKLTTNPSDPFNFATDVTKGKQFWEGLLVRFPAIGVIVKAGISIISPLAWIVIGGSLASSNLKKAAVDKDVWITTARMLIIRPLVIFGIIAGLVYLRAINSQTGTLIVVLAACPPAAVTIIFSAAYKHEHTTFTAEVNSLGTLCCLLALPVWTVIAHATYSSIIS